MKPPLFALSVCLCVALPASAQDAKPAKEHAWLNQIVGEWATDAEAIMGPGQPAVKAKGNETIRPFGAFWVVADSTTEMVGATMSGRMTLGYDADKKKYVGTWIDTMGGLMWKYEGAVDASGKILTLETEGPNMQAPGKNCKYKETIEIKGKDHKVFTSSMQGEDGKWFTFMTINAKRKP